MVDLDRNNSCPARLQTCVMFHEKGESGTVFLVLVATSGDDCLDFWGMLRFCVDLKILVVHRTTGFQCSGGLT